MGGPPVCPAFPLLFFGRSRGGGWSVRRLLAVRRWRGTAGSRRSAGLDTRGFRLVWPHGVQLWELDREDVLGFKQEVLDAAGATPTCARTALPMDLREDWTGALVQSGFDREQSTAWLVEGLLLYLDAEQAERLLVTVTRLSASGSQLGVGGQREDCDRRAGPRRTVHRRRHWRRPGAGGWVRTGDLARRARMAGNRAGSRRCRGRVRAPRGCPLGRLPCHRSPLHTALIPQRDPLSDADPLWRQGVDRVAGGSANGSSGAAITGAR
jgi:hypothetical protein